MKKILILSVLSSFSINAAPPVTHQFTNGTTIEASQINANYQELADRIEVLQNQITSLQSLQPKQLVGFTTADAITTNNYLALTMQCQAEYIGSRICNTREVAETVDIPVLPNSDTKARVVPNYTSLSYDGNQKAIIDSVAGTLSTSTPCILVELNPSYLGETFSSSCNATSGFKIACCK